MASASQIKRFEADILTIRKFISADMLAAADGGLITILKEDPLYAPALKLRSQVLAAMDYFQQALASAIVLTAVIPNSAENWVLRGRLELEVGFAHSAIYSFTTARELGVGDVDDLIREAQELRLQQR